MDRFIRSRKVFFITGLVISDTVLLCLSFFIANALRFKISLGGPAEGFQTFRIQTLLLLIPSCLIIFHYFDLYRLRRGWRFFELFLSIIAAVTIGTVFFLTASYLIESFPIPG